MEYAGTVGKRTPVQRSAGRTICDFVHSYYLEAEEEEIVKAVTWYGTKIHASVEKGDVFACQFHPEKSSSTGLLMLKNFVEL